MSKLAGHLSSFRDLDKISVQGLTRWIPHPPNPFYIENYLANRIFYPQTVPQTKEDQDLELAILREALIKNPSFFSNKEGKFLIPQSLISCTNLGQIVWAYLDVYKPKGLIRVFLKNQKTYTLGTVLVPDVNKKEGLIELVIENKKYSVKIGNLEVIPCPKNYCDINFFSKSARIMGKNEESLEVFGGDLGIVVDARGLN